MDYDPYGLDWLQSRATVIKAAREAAAQAMRASIRILEVEAKHAKERAACAERTAAVLARRCAEQARTIAALLAKHEPAPIAKPDPVHAAIAAMQRQGVR